jgi:hypothetical protein
MMLIALILPVIFPFLVALVFLQPAHRRQSISSGLGGLGLFVCLGCSAVVISIPFLASAFLTALFAVICHRAQASRQRFLLLSLGVALLTDGLALVAAYRDRQHLASVQYPVESMEERLAYERRRTPDRVGAALGTAEETASGPRSRLLTLTENWTEEESNSPLVRRRQDALRRLHDEAVLDFINSPGFGVSRGIPSPRPWLTAPTPEPFRQPPQQPDSYPWRPLTGDEQEPAARKGADLVSHKDRIVEFVNVPGFGYVKDRRHVAGFRPHGLGNWPPYTRSQEYTHRDDERIELVSLLKHDPPGVYLSENLPRMQDLHDAPVRALDDFEETALGELRQGHDLVTGTTPQHFRMLGAIRAGKQCLACHDVERGELLGAFSYHFTRPGSR